MGANNSLDESGSAPEVARRIAKIQHGADVAARENELQVDLIRQLQRLKINNRPRKVPFEIQVHGKITIQQNATVDFPSPQISIPPQSQNPGPSRISSSARVNLDTLFPPPPRSSPPTSRQTHNNFSHHDNHRGHGGRGRRGQGHEFRGDRGRRGANNGVTTNEHLPNQTRFHGNENNNNDQQQPREHRGRWQNRGQNRGQQRGRGGGQRSGDDQNPNPNQNQNQRRGGRSRGRGRSQSASRPSAEQQKREIQVGIILNV